MLCVEKVGTQDSLEDEVETTMFNQRKRGEEMKNCHQQNATETTSLNHMKKN